MECSNTSTGHWALGTRYKVKRRQKKNIAYLLNRVRQAVKYTNTTTCAIAWQMLNAECKPSHTASKQCNLRYNVVTE